MSIDNPSIVEGNINGSTSLIFTVSLTQPNAGPNLITVDFQSNDGTATNGADYTTVSGTLDFSVGQQSRQISVPIISDTTVETPTNETFTVDLSNPSAGVQLPVTMGTGTIIDDDVRIVSINDPTFNEGNSGCNPAATPPNTVAANFAISVVPNNPPASNPLSFRFSTQDGTAQDNNPVSEDNDYVPVSGVLHTLPTDGNTITIRVRCDNTIEANENFTLVLSDPNNVTFSKSIGTATILNDDNRVFVSIDSGSVMEGDTGTSFITFTVTMSQPNPGPSPITINFTTTPGSATEGASCTGTVDYRDRTGSLIFSAGEVISTLDVEVCSDVTAEPNEEFNVNLSSSSPIVFFSDSTGLGTIIDDD